MLPTWKGPVAPSCTGPAAPLQPWPQDVTTTVTHSPVRSAYEVADVGLPVENPWHRLVRPGDVQFLGDGTAALVDPDLAGRLVRTWGAARIAIAIDVRDGRAVGHGWTPSDTGVDAVDAVVRLAGAGVATFEVTAIAQDGLLGGPDLALCRRMVGLGIGDVIASAGIASAADLRAVRDLGCRGAIVGRALYDGTLALDEALAEGRPA